MLKYLSKITTDILPSVAATIIGAYIVNHYIATKPGTEASAAVAVSQATPKKVDAAAATVDNTPAAGVRAKGISEKAIFEKPVAEKPAEKSASAEKPAQKSSEKTVEPEDKQAETASIAAESRRHPPREKTAIRVIPLTATAPTAQPAASVTAPPAPTVEAAIIPDEHRDANDLARAAIQRLRGGSETSPRAQDTIRVPDAGPAPRVASVPQAQVPQVAAVRPLPPPIMVSTPPADNSGPGSLSTQPYSATALADDPHRPIPPADIPPADIPPAAPIELRAEPVDASAQPHTNVAEDMLLAAKSVFHAVLPQ
ncbi:MAG: hypothetical protein KGK01_16945 [Bradyrhizobium sp.]|uniref:hypothetical protein n=1 Tax=Bradyrhizobium sp. TaxID=376 RepID=UPI001C28EEED|nr:hypothetical protein [Bradyrhizobium sp.]MBU6464489.1 hypothetical protein [Pseudomonadota bacterium]MDE2069384.1 hypothetical protein [Bradyrhizobium sp.]MDE2244053.1 hypothetical protein [Bradyrhizobium sp.]MDE2467629.1 hypothetical protein [Bradyrhizobium sp.]